MILGCRFTGGFIAKIRETGAQLLGMSALLTTTMTVQREVIRQLEAEGMRDHIRVMVGGAPVTASWADEIGADGYAEDAVGAVGLAQRLMGLGGVCMSGGNSFHQ